MNKLFLLTYLLFFFNVIKVFSQSIEYTFKIEYLMTDNSTRPSSLFELMFDGSVVKANSEGMVYYTREIGRNSILIDISDPNYTLIGPQTIAFPDDSKFITRILIHKKSNKEQGAAAFTKQLKKLNISIEQANAKDLSTTSDIKRAVDSIMKLLMQKYKVSEKELRDATEILVGRDKYFNLISYSLEGYLNEAKDIRDIFKNMLVFSLENPRSFRLLDSTIKVYNSFYNNLNNYNNEYEKAVKTYWQSEELALGFHNVFDYAINNIHRSNILLLNTQFTEKANRYIHENNKKKRKDLKDEITNSLITVLSILDNNLVVLENKIKYHIGKLEIEREILNN